ncbi:MAG: DUF429 domain-containing protein [Acidimicrobiales bacterium]
MSGRQLISPRADMSIAGVDMSSQTTDTAACVLTIEGETLVATAYPKVDDTELRAAMQAPNVFVGIDAPFGWPAPFAAFAAAWSGRSGRHVPPWAELDHRSWREVAEALKFRATDRFVRLYLRAQHVCGDNCPSRWPDGFSVSADKLALPALRTMRLLAAANIVDITGETANVVEVYPGPALAAWHLSGEGYKGTRRREGKDTPAFTQRKTAAHWLVDQLRTAAPFDVNADSLDLLEEQAAESDHNLDALVCALTAWAAKVGHTHTSTGEQFNAFWTSRLERSGGRSEADLRQLVGDLRGPTEVVAEEGWIHHPRSEPNSFLAQVPR